MSPQTRALIIGLFGPALQAIGLGWDLLEHVILAGPGETEFTLGHILTDGAHLTIAVGLVLSVVCIPLAIQIALARPEELEMPDFEPERSQVAPEVSAETWKAAS